MPNAVFIGFTGSPLLVQDRATSLEVFGGYIHTYKFSEGVEDGVVLDLVYIVVHEMAHLLEPTHNARFIGLMDQFMPNWPHRRDQLNQLPVRHEKWGY